jgi:hypothetical protein
MPWNPTKNQYEGTSTSNYVYNLAVCLPFDMVSGAIPQRIINQVAQFEQ